MRTNNFIRSTYGIPYRAGEDNRCPGCARANWLVGRITAECAFCGTALIISEARHYLGARVARGERRCA